MISRDIKGSGVKLLLKKLLTRVNQLWWYYLNLGHEIGKLCLRRTNMLKPQKRKPNTMVSMLRNSLKKWHRLFLVGHTYKTKSKLGKIEGSISYGLSPCFTLIGVGPAMRLWKKSCSLWRCQVIYFSWFGFFISDPIDKRHEFLFHH